MKALFPIALSILTSELAAGPRPASSQNPDQPPSAWAREIPLLNQEFTAQSGMHIPFSQPVEADLAQIYQRELNELSSVAKSRFGSSKSKDRIQRDKINAFFHDEIRKLNQANLAKLSSSKQQPAAPLVDHRKTASKVLEYIKAHPVAGLAATSSYDSSGQVGFCFGRAMLAHHQLLKAGIPQQDMAKIFMFGDLMVNRQLWKFHVALMLRDGRDGFIVVDPLFDSILNLSDWVARASKFDVKGKFSRARFFVTDPRKFLPSFGKYHLDQLEDSHLRKYFDDLASNL